MWRVVGDHFGFQGKCLEFICLGYWKVSKGLQFSPGYTPIEGWNFKI